MNQRYAKIFFLAIMAAFFPLGRVLAGPGEIEPAPRNYVEDRAGVIEGGTRNKLIGLLQELEQKTGARIVVLTVKTTSGEDIQSYAFERADKWKFGANQKSASVLMAVAVGDREYFTEVGYDYEGILTDGFVGEVGRRYFVPNFRANRYGQGIYEAAAALAGKIAQEKGVTLSGMPKLPKSVGVRTIPCCGGFLPLILFFIFFSLFSNRRSRGLLFWGLLAGSMLGGGRGGYGGGGFGGGGFGGFGGGGGGGFGGGGAGGSW